METTKLPPHKAAAARKRAEKEKAEQDRLLENLPPHKKAAAVHQMAAKKMKEEQEEEEKKDRKKKEQEDEEEEERPKTDQAQRFDATFRYRRPGPQKKKVQEKSIETSQTLFRSTVFVVPESFDTEVVEEAVVPENATTITTVSAEATAEKGDDIDEALTDIAEIERDIALARTKPGLEATSGCQAYHYREDEGEEINERDAYQVAYGRSFVKVSGKKPC